mmetsp:Transcript_17332/g.24102  ORF Transcript_17332/g.24102 Transcript_17332/m.24102 type:complete len:184 (+) Transcript_17332:136-687(+)
MRMHSEQSQRTSLMTPREQTRYRSMKNIIMKLRILLVFLYLLLPFMVSFTSALVIVSISEASQDTSFSESRNNASITYDPFEDAFFYMVMMLYLFCQYYAHVRFEPFLSTWMCFWKVLCPSKGGLRNDEIIPKRKPTKIHQLSPRSIFIISDDKNNTATHSYVNESRPNLIPTPTRLNTFISA